MSCTSVILSPRIQGVSSRCRNIPIYSSRTSLKNLFSLKEIIATVYAVELFTKRVITGRSLKVITANVMLID